MSSYVTTVAAFDKTALPVGGILRITKLLNDGTTMDYVGMIMSVKPNTLELVIKWPTEVNVMPESIAIADVVSGDFTLELIPIVV